MKNIFKLLIKLNLAFSIAIFIVISLIASFLIIKKQDFNLNNSKNPKIKYEKTISAAQNFYKNYEKKLKIDEYILLKLISEKNAKYTEILNSRYSIQEYNNDPFLRILKKDYKVEGLSIRRKLNQAQIKEIGYADYELNNKFYSFTIKGEPVDYFLVDKWDDILAKALYCDTTGYDYNDFRILKYLRDYRGDYYDTHYLLSLLFLKKNNCYDANILDSEIESVSSDILEACHRDSRFSDLYAERIVALYWAGYGEFIKEEWIDKINNSLSVDYGWRNFALSKSNPHTTGLALLSLIYYSDKKDRQVFY